MSARFGPAATDEVATGDAPLTLAIAVADPLLHDRLVALLSNVPGVRLVTASEDEAEADGAGAVLVDPRTRPTPHPKPADAVANRLDPGFTPRERQVLDLLAEGASNREIAARLDISVHTAKFHVGSILDKLDSTGRTDAVAQAARIGVLQL
ncbi:MAG: response regulator transcription factor [Lautropia sp.]